MKVRVKVPKVGLTVEEVTLTSWEKKVGDKVVAGDTIALAEADKASVEIVAPAQGVLVSWLAGEGDTLPIGAELAIIET